MDKLILKNLVKKVFGVLLCIMIAVGPGVSNWSFVFERVEAYPIIRQELNIIDAYTYADTGVFATSSAIVNVDATKYDGATYYFEVVASTTAATNATVSLVNSTSSVPTVNITVNGTSYARYRSAAFTPPNMPTDYIVKLGNEAVGKGIIAARVVVIQSDTVINSTQTQIEIGNQETYTNTATSTFASPKYWLYDSTKWDGSPTFYAEITYNTIAGVASTTRYDAAGTYTYTPPVGTASTTVEIIGGGGAGGGNIATANTGGAGGAGGQYAKKTVPIAGFGNHTLVVAATRAGTSNAAGTVGNDSTWDTTTVVAKGGAGGALSVSGGVAATSTGSLTGCVGDVCYAGGDGANGAANSGGGGGSGAGTLGTGNSASVAGVAGAARALSGGAGGAKNTGNAAGTAGSAVTGYGGGGGGGAHTTAATARAGGTGGKGTATTTSWIATTTISLQESDGTGDGFQNFTTKVTIVGRNPVATSTRVRSAAFTPTNGRNYRIAFANGKTGATFAIYNAKIVVDQTSNPTKFETQYLLANTRFFAGTALQNFLTRWDPAEWSSTTNTYLHEANSVVAGTSDIKLQDTSGPTDITGSTLTDIVQREQSSAMTMPGAAATIDTIATTNNSDIYSSKIMAQVVLIATTSVPTSLTATPGNGQVTVAWAAPASLGNLPILYYEIYRGTGSPATAPIASTTNTTYFDHAIANGTAYFYRVRAFNSQGVSGYSNEQSTTPTEAAGAATRSQILLRNIRLLFSGGRIKFF